MALREPTSADECVYVTNRFVGEDGSVFCWVFKEKCKKCGKGMMGKPRDASGKVKIRAKEYVCPECGYNVEKQSYEDGLTASVKYTCPKCKHSGEMEMPFKRKKVEGVSSLVFDCQKCKEKIYVTKKMKEVREEDSGDT